MKFTLELDYDPRQLLARAAGLVAASVDPDTETQAENALGTKSQHAAVQTLCDVVSGLTPIEQHPVRTDDGKAGPAEHVPGGSDGVRA